MVVQHVAHFEILRQLGKGAMGEVYLARDTRLDRLVALKMFPQSAAVLHEARLASAVNHPNVAHVYQAEELGDLQYIAMEYVEGKTLDALMAELRLPPNEILGIATQIAGALEEAHRKGVIHRDIKPSNVMLTAAGVVKVLDFGLAKADGGASHDGLVAGTIAYMSPEQALGEPSDRRSDIFSFGVLLYEMLAGRRPFEATSVTKTLAQILSAPPPPIDGQNPALEQIILRCLEKDPEDRYQSASELLEDLRKIPGARGSGFRRRTIAIAAVLVAVVIGVAAERRWQARSAKGIESVAVLPFTTTGDEDAQSIGDGLAETLINRLSRVSELRVVSRPASFAYKATSLAASQIGRKLRADALVTGRITRTGDRLLVQVEMIDAGDDRQLWGTQYTGSVYDLVRIQDDIATSIGKVIGAPVSKGEQHFVRAAMTRDPEAYRQYMLARRLTNDRKSSSLRKSFQYYEAALKRDPQFALAHAGVAESYIVLVSKRGMDVREGYRRALAAATRAQELDPYSAEVQTLLGDILTYDRWDWEGAERHFRKAIELNPNYETARHWYGTYLSIMGRHDEALQQVKIARQLDPAMPRFIAAEGRVLFTARRYAEAEREMKRALEIDPKNANSWDQLASIYLSQGRVDESVAAFQKSLNAELARKIGDAYATGGYRAVRLVILEDLQVRAKAGKYVSPADWAIAYARLGDMDGAYRWLEVMHEERNETMPRIFNSPSWDPIRKDPRYSDLVRKVGLRGASRSLRASSMSTDHSPGPEAPSPPVPLPRRRSTVAISSVRVRAPVFSNSRLMWVRSVLSAIFIRPPIVFDDCPASRRRTTSSSRGVKDHLERSVSSGAD